MQLDLHTNLRCMRERTWVILLAGGSAHTQESQNHRVKNSSGEFAARLDRQTLLKMALSRAHSIVPREQIVVVIDREQKLRWSESVAMLPGVNVIAQPHHRGSAIEVLLAVLTMLERDPSARVIAMPSDHYLVAHGALWDSSIAAARAPVLVGLLRACMPDFVDQIETALAQGDGADVRQRALARVYAGLPAVDLSHVLAQGAAAECRVITSRCCGWSNLASARRTISARLPSAGRAAATV
jgi:mannose-1-phosphate guanylyltransferase